MSEVTTVNVDEVQRLADRRRELNKIDFQDATFVDDAGNELHLSPEEMRTASFAGLSTCSLVELFFECKGKMK